MGVDETLDAEADAFDAIAGGWLDMTTRKSFRALIVCSEADTKASCDASVGLMRKEYGRSDQRRRRRQNPRREEVWSIERRDLVGSERYEQHDIGVGASSMGPCTLVHQTSSLTGRTSSIV